MGVTFGDPVKYIRNLMGVIRRLKSSKAVLGNDAVVFKLRLWAVVALHFLALLAVIVWIADFGSVKRVTFAAGPLGSDSYTLAQSLARVAERYHPELEVAVLETQGSRENMALINEGGSHLAVVHAHTRPGPPSRLIASLYQDFVHIVAQPGSAIKSAADLAEHRIAIPPEGSGGYELFWSTIDYYRIGRNLIEVVPMNWNSSAFALASGMVDAIFTIRASGNDDILRLLDETQARLVPVRLARGLVLRVPELSVGHLRAGAYGGRPSVPSEDLITIAVERMLIAHADLDPNIATIITGALFERRRELFQSAPVAVFARQPDVVAGTLIPVHPGAQAFFDRHQPNFLQENADSLAFLVSALAISLSGIFHALGRRKRRRVDFYNRELVTMAATVAVCRDMKDLEQARERLHSLVGEIVRDSEKGRVAQEAFEFFTFTWNATEMAIRDKAEELREPPAVGGSPAS